MEVRVYVDWPGAPLTQSLVLRAIKKLALDPVFVSSSSVCSDKQSLQWATYDSIDHELTLTSPSSVLASSFTIRKALIRKHFLHRCITAYTTKHKDSSLTLYVPRTWDIEISLADELDELWYDELWDLDKELQEASGEWWILKPGMADRGMGIRLFDSKGTLQSIFEEFEKDDDDNYEEFANGTNVLTSQLRHFVIQEYLAHPLLLDPTQATLENQTRDLESLAGRKFHLRAYCVASGALTVYLYPRILALFSSETYRKPSLEDPDLRPHLTNTCLQGAGSEANVRLLHELIGCNILSGSRESPNYQGLFTEEDVSSIIDQISDTLSETFKAAIQMPVHFQPLPNAFELFGVDFLVGHSPPGRTSGRFEVKLLEFNSEPAIEMTGERLRWILEDLFELIGKTCVEPFFNARRGLGGNTPSSKTSQRSSGLRTCLAVNLHE